jgi:VWFA-related protein
LLLLVLLASVVAPQATPSGVRPVQVSVVVHDSRHDPVDDLTTRDFQVLEDGREVPVSLVDVYADAGPNVVEDGHGVFTNHVRSPSKGGVVALVFDRSNTSPEHRALARDQIVTHLGQVAPDDRIALYVLGEDGMQVLHDFTDDARPLLASLKRASSRQRSRAQGAVPRHNRFGDSTDAQIDEFVNGDLRATPPFYERRRRPYSSVKGLEEVAEHLAGVPGRKNVIWVASGSRVTPEEAARVLNDSDVALYSVTVRGVESAEVMAADGLASIADWTGGRAFNDTKDLGDAIRAAVDDSRMSYALSYPSAQDGADGSFRSITVSVRRPGVTVRHRTGYFAIPPARPTATAATQEIVEALDSPLESTELPLVVGARADGQGRHVLTLQIDTSGLTLKRYGDRWSGSFDITVAQTLGTGEHVRDADVTVPLSFPDAMRDEFLEDGVAVTRTITLRPDAHQVRVIARDVPSSDVGSVIIPAGDLRKP